MVHCLAGVSRSVSLVLAYLIKHRGMTYRDAYDLIKGRRRIIHPNDGFIEQLKRFERELPASVPQQ
jgi:protein-tyrosine phosphatase